MSFPIASDTLLVRQINVLGADLEHETVLMSVDNGAYYGLNETATRIWALLETPITPARIETVLMDEFDVDSDTCHARVAAHLQQLMTHGIIQVVGGA